MAAKLGAPVIRVFAGAEPEGHSRDEGEYKGMVENLKECVEVGIEHGVLVGIQNHGDFFKTAEQGDPEVVKMVDSDWFGVLVDTGNFQQGDAYEEIRQSHAAVCREFPGEGESVWQRERGSDGCEKTG